MQKVSELWETLRMTPGTEVEWRFDINGVTYGPEAEVSHTATAQLFSEFGMGGASCAGLELQLMAKDIPRGAEVRRFCRLVNGEQASEWIPKGIYFINRRSEEDGYWSIEAFDAMRKTEQVWEPEQNLEFPMPMDAAVREMCRVMQVTLDERSALRSDYTMDYPIADNHTFRQILQWIAAAHGGNFIFTDEGKLRLVPLISIPEESFYLVDQHGRPITFGGTRILIGSDDTANTKVGDNEKHFIGLNLFHYKNNGKRKPVSRITLATDDDNAFTAGDDSGTHLLADCAYATQAMANDLLEQLRGYRYQALEAEGADLDPAAELGDGITAARIYTVLASITENGDGYPDISAPGEQELEDEYPEEGFLERKFNYKLAQNYSLIEKTAEMIRMEVYQIQTEIEGDISAVVERQTTLEITAAGLQTQITENKETADGQYSSLSAKIDITAAGLDGRITSEVSNLNGEIDSLENSFSITAAGLDGRITSEVSNLNGEIDSLENSFNITASGLDGRITSEIGALSGEIENLETTFSARAGQIEASVSDLNEDLSQTVRLAPDGFTITNATGSTLTIDGGQLRGHSVTADEIDATNLKVSAANITGRLVVGNLPEDTATVDDIPTSVSDLENDEGYQTERGVVEIIDGTINADYINALGITAVSIESSYVSLSDDNGSERGNMEIGRYDQRDTIWLNSDGLLFLTAEDEIFFEAGSGYAGFYDGILTLSGDCISDSMGSLGYESAPWDIVYSESGVVETSDRNRKKDISYGLGAFDSFFDDLKPVQYRLLSGTSNRKHMGFIAQDVRDSLERLGISTADFAGYVEGKDNDGNPLCGLRNVQLIPLLVEQVQVLKARMSGLEQAMAG